MNTRIFLASGLAAFALAAGVLMLAIKPGKPEPASLAGAQVAAGKATAGSIAQVQVSPGKVANAGADQAPAPQSTPAAVKDDTFIIKRILPIKGAIKYGEWHWDETGVPSGPIVVTVDLEARVLSIFRAGYEIGATAVLLGAEEKPTPLGVFPITQKDKDHVSNIYTGAPMPYMQRLTNDGITLHGSNVERGYASHGCIGMPNAFAAKLFAATHLGDKVYITRGKQVGMGDNLVGA
ncbi:ErfK/YbiS/YcfS/YnhG protein [Novosphingobium sp. Rr 2-17]|uniref:L,D-transpeptidase family protein n=1 Tax=Novosphingobium sp. Rr 2-17 TaxID=555793 RepID=UPI0002697B16|nr:L,D-transpeptidase family protein [Novosphingobium sp. Rr 2-17]EIZ80734.1 ErfK/YbiS/YcfS/YnhG protein [Novosphingobium sp. Rr 2-17]